MIWIIIFSFGITALETKYVFVKRPKFKPVVIFLLSLSVFVITLVKYFADKKDDKYKNESGIIDGSLKDGDIIYPAIAIGGAVFENIGTGNKLFEDISLEAWIQNEELFINTDITDTAGNLIARIVANEWKVNPNFRFDRNFDDRAVEVQDNQGHIVLKADFDGKKVNLEAIYFFKDTSHTNVIGMQLYGTKGKGGNIQFLYKGKEIKYSIKPLFKYPSDLHHGERIDED